MMEALSISETSVKFYVIARRNMPETYVFIPAGERT
jgi:hypothetical protein